MVNFSTYFQGLRGHKNFSGPLYLHHANPTQPVNPVPVRVFTFPDNGIPNPETDPNPSQDLYPGSRPRLNSIPGTNGTPQPGDPNRNPAKNYGDKKITISLNTSMTILCRYIDLYKFIFSLNNDHGLMSPHHHPLSTSLCRTRLRIPWFGGTFPQDVSVIQNCSV